MNIITPDVAIAHQKFEYHSLTADGQIVVCPKDAKFERTDTCQDYYGKNKWRLLKDVVPRGRTFVGYSIDAYRNDVYVYWK